MAHKQQQYTETTIAFSH